MVKIPIMKFVLLAIIWTIAQVTAEPPKFTQLFNGKNLEGWEGIGGPTSNWKVEDGVLSCTGKAGSNWIATKQEYADFELRLEYQIPKDGNSGIFIRSPRKGTPWVNGLEIQILDDYGEKWKSLKSNQFTGAIYAVVAPSVRATKKAGQWQTVRIRCNGPKCDVWVNKKHVVSANFETLANQYPRVPGLKQKSGVIGLQNHSSPVHFRNIEICSMSENKQ